MPENPSAIRAAVIGASGYTGGELLRLLLGHPRLHVAAATSDRSAGKPVADLFPNLRGRTDMAFEPLNPEKIADRVEVCFLAVPHGDAMDLAALFLDRGKKVVDLSADFRLRDPAAYSHWYRHEHRHPELLNQAVYGLPELHRERIKPASLVANPGCYSTGALLGVLPLLDADTIWPDSIIVDAKSGVSGAGRTPDTAYHFPEANESLTAYGLVHHRHRPEMEQIASEVAGKAIVLTFTPHLLPVTRGIYTAVYARVRDRSLGAEALADRFERKYRNEPFVQFLPPGRLPNLHGVRGSNDCHISLSYDPSTGVVTVLTAIDNLVKGAAGQAIQNMNLMLGLDETAGLLAGGLFP